MNIVIDEKPAHGADICIVRKGEILPQLEPPYFPKKSTIITPLYEDDGYLCASAVSEQGVVTQHAFSHHADYTYKSGDTLEIFRVGNTLCGIAVDVDALRPEVYRAMALRGVQVVFAVRFFARGDYNEDFVMFGPWSNAQANNLFVVDANNVESNIICPCALSGDNSGFLARGIVGAYSCELPLERFYEGQRSFPVFQSLNYELYTAHFGENKE